MAGTVHIAGVGNGNPSDHDPDKASYRRAFAGKCRVLVGEAERAGRSILTAMSPGLKSASITVEAK